jgi:hypothetical protein
MSGVGEVGEVILSNSLNLKNLNLYLPE